MPTPPPITDETRAVTLLRLLREDVRVMVLKSIPQPLRSQLAEKIHRSEVPVPSPRRQQQILDEFQRLFLFLVDVQGPRLQLVHGEPEEFEAERDTPYVPTGNAGLDLERMNLYQLCDALNAEQPRTVAILLQFVSSRRVAAILGELSEEQRTAVALEMARSPQVPRAVAERMAQQVISKATTKAAPTQKPSDPILRLADVLRETERTQRRELLTSIGEEDAERAAELQQAIYRFDDLLNLDDRQVQAVLGQVDAQNLQTSLFEADPKLVDKVLKNLSRRAAATLQEELSYQRRIPAELVQNSRAMVVRAIATVEEEGG